MFAAVLLDEHNQPYYINLKLEPMEGELMRQQYPDIIPGYYSNKQHWNSVKVDGEIPDDLLKHWLDRSYELILKGFRSRSSGRFWDCLSAGRTAPPVRFTAACAPVATKLAERCFMQTEKPVRSMHAVPISTDSQIALPVIEFPVKSGRQPTIRP